MSRADSAQAQLVLADLFMVVAFTSILFQLFRLNSSHHQLIQKTQKSSLWHKQLHHSEQLTACLNVLILCGGLGFFAAALASIIGDDESSIWAQVTVLSKLASGITSCFASALLMPLMTGTMKTLQLLEAYCDDISQKLCLASIKQQNLQEELDYRVRQEDRRDLVGRKDRKSKPLVKIAQPATASKDLTMRSFAESCNCSALATIMSEVQVLKVMQTYLSTEELKMTFVTCWKLFSLPQCLHEVRRKLNLIESHSHNQTRDLLAAVTQGSRLPSKLVKAAHRNPASRMTQLLQVLAATHMLQKSRGSWCKQVDDTWGIFLHKLQEAFLPETKTHASPCRSCVSSECSWQSVYIWAASLNPTKLCVILGAAVDFHSSPKEAQALRLAQLLESVQTRTAQDVRTG